MLSKVGRLQLIQTLLNSLPLYYLSIFKMPKTILQKINSIQRRFLWGGDDDKKVFSSIAWHNIEAPKDLGGLGVKSIKIQNLGFLLKWFWSYCDCDDKFWKRVIQSIHNLPHNFLSPSDLHSVNSGPLHYISQAMKHHAWVNGIF